MKELEQILREINWDFADYSSTKYPLDINSIPWYPATFPVPIPKFLISLLTNESDIVLDPFGGKGTTSIEALKQNRTFFYNDINPFAVEIVKDIIGSLYYSKIDLSILTELCKEKSGLKRLKSETYRFDIRVEKDMEESDILKYYPNNILKRLDKIEISHEAIWWYHVDTLIELLNIIETIESDSNRKNGLYVIKKFAFTSILKDVSSQRGHFTYVTDNCHPKTLHYYDAISAYTVMLERIKLSVTEFLKQNKLTNKNDKFMQSIAESYIHQGDARKLEWIDDEIVDLVVTSPPYLCAQDYIKTMRLCNLFYPNIGFSELPSKEIGPRSKRRGKTDKVVLEFYKDMNKVFKEIHRVLKQKKFFCLIIGQGKGRITKGYDTISDLRAIALECGFEEFFCTKRKISYKSVRIGGVDTEEIIIYQKR